MNTEHPLVRFIIICLLVLVLVFACGNASANSLPDVLSKDGKIVGQGDCVIQQQPKYCLLVTHQGVTYGVIGFLKGKDFYVQHILAEVNGTFVPVWNYNDVRI